MSKVGSVIKCKQCGKGFVKKIASEKYCCRECYKKAQAEQIADSNYKKNENRATGKTKEKVCIVCGTPFYTKRSRTLCCSGACTIQHRKDLLKYQSISEPKEIECAVCGEKFIRHHSRQVCCSPECSAERQKEQLRSYNRAKSEERAKKKKPKPLTKVLEEMKEAGYQPHEYGKYMAIQYMQNH